MAGRTTYISVQEATVGDLIQRMSPSKYKKDEWVPNPFAAVEKIIKAGPLRLVTNGDPIYGKRYYSRERLVAAGPTYRLIRVTED